MTIELDRAIELIIEKEKKMLVEFEPDREDVFVLNGKGPYIKIEEKFQIPKEQK